MIIEKEVQFRGEIYKVEIDGYEFKITQNTRIFQGVGVDLTEEVIKKLILRMNNIPYEVYKYEKFMEWDGIIK